MEERHVKLPTSDERYSAELKYKAYHVSLMTIDMIVNRNLPFLLPFIVHSELQAEASNPSKPAYVSSLRQQIEAHEAQLSSMIDSLTPKQLETLRITIEYLWGRSYTDSAFTCGCALAPGNGG